ncbi:MAG: flagellar biosynthesis protein FlhF [Gammaproteobacteria bacterium]|nr:MAG: flagellar biosynthesis protein FlhF [Gammaproteobacteria bacterium]
MKMKRYFAPDSRQALRALRDEQGPEAVILSNRRVKGGVEIIAAMDYENSMVDSSTNNTSARPEKNQKSRQQQSYASQNNPVKRMDTSVTQEVNNNFFKDADITNNHYGENQLNHESDALNKIQGELAGLRSIMEAPLMHFSWRETGRVQPLYASLLKQLLTLGLSSALSKSIAKRIEKQGLNNNSWSESLNYLADLVPVDNEDILSSGGTVSLIGPTGVGKTTTIAKLAARFALKHGRRCVTLITTDNYRIGAHEQLRSYGRILGIPVHVASDSDELRSLLLEVKGQSNKRHLTLIDTAGVSQKDISLTEQMTSLDVDGLDIKNYLVLSATGQMNQQDDVIRAFSSLHLDGCVISKIDEAASLGETISVLIQHNLPISFVCDGQKVPDNLHQARGNLLVKEAIKLMKNLKKSLSDEELAYAFGGVTSNAKI